jgi:hypothetical protein
MASGEDALCHAPGIGRMEVQGVEMKLSRITEKSSTMEATGPQFCTNVQLSAPASSSRRGQPRRRSLFDANA